MRVLVIGAGNMGLTYAKGMSKSGVLKKRNIMVLDKSKETMKKVDKIANFDAMDQLEDCVPKADIIFIAVKPYHSEELLGRMRPLVNANQMIVSIMAGVTIDFIKNALGTTKIVRAMPNLPAQVGKGLTSYVSSSEVSYLELILVEQLLNTTGASVRVKDENLIDASTGISGSGPAYVFYFMESMMEAARQMGFSEKVSKVLVSQTFSGAIELFNQSSISPDDWMNKVASKGGTTRAALDSLTKNNVNDLIKDAAFAAFERAVELGEEY
jgi:pyrroline-5-carboxylate reductase